MRIHSTCLASGLGLCLIVLAVPAGRVAAAEPTNLQQISKAMAAAEQQAAKSESAARSLYSSDIEARPYMPAVAAMPDKAVFSRPMLLADAASAEDMPVAGRGSAIETGLEPVPISATKATNESAATVFSIREDLKNTPRWLWEDTKRVYTNPVNLAILLSAGGASVALHQHVDWTINNKFDQSRTCKEAWGDAAKALGHPLLQLGVAGAWYMAGYEFKDLKTYNVGKNLLSALIITDLSTLAIKGACAGTQRPNGDHYAFPSGHASSSFAMAAVLDNAYGHAVGIPMYAFAGWVGFERLDDRKHMFSDVVFGSVLGLVIGHSVATGHLPQIAGGNIIPYADPEAGAGVVWWKAM